MHVALASEREMNTRFDINQISSPISARFMLRRTPRRKLVFSSSDDETATSPQSICSVRAEHHAMIQDEQLSSHLVTRSKLEHYGFNMLLRPSKRLTQWKKRRTNESCHSMQTRSQSSSDCPSDQLVNLFDQTLSTVTPSEEQRARLRPLPLCLSENETNMPVLTLSNSAAGKRTHEDEENSERALSIKRRKCFDEAEKENHCESNIKRARRGIGLIRSFTEPNEEQIKASVELGTNRDLIGDRSSTYLLPRCKSRKHADLACIHPETMVQLLENVYSSSIEHLQIIDCRYPYEYEGGHIQSARNLYTRSQVFEQYFRQPMEVKDPSKRNILIFHCEFSSERAPALLRYFRAEDRSLNEKNYPHLLYPEIYLLEGGYKAFYEHSKELCQPTAYRLMVDVNFQEDYRRCRLETKSCGTSERTAGGRRRTRPLAFRSCLSYSSQTNVSPAPSERRHV